MKKAGGEVLGQRALNRALLQRQHLLSRTTMPAAAMLEHLVGMQGQTPLSPYYGLWARLDGFDPSELAGLLETRQAVRAPLMRSTIHLVTARDCLALRPVVQHVLERVFYSQSPYGRAIAGIDLDELLEAGRTLLSEQPRTSAAVRRLLGARWPDRDSRALPFAIQYLVPLVQVPPRGMWGRSGQATWTTVEAWLGERPTASAAPDETVLRYLAAFGPASAADFRTWSGVADGKAAMERLRPRLRTFRDERGRELFDLPDAPLADPETPAPPRFMPDYDNVMLSHADRGRIVAEEDRQQLLTGIGIGAGTVLIDGFVGATWAIRRERGETRRDRSEDRPEGGEAILEVQPLRPPGSDVRAAIAEEAERLLSLAAADARHKIEFSVPT